MPKVLLVEDDNNLREIFEMRLQAEGYDTVSASDGEEALVAAVKEKPDLIIADVMMPKLSGFEMVEAVRAAPEMANVKVIMMTALGQAEDRARGDKLGVVKYLVKSQVTLEDFIRVVREVLPPNQDGSGPAPSTPGDSDKTESVGDNLNNKPQESEGSSMQDDSQTTPTNPQDAPAADSGAQTTEQEQTEVQGQVDEFVAGGGPAAPASDAGAADTALSVSPTGELGTGTGAANDAPAADAPADLSNPTPAPDAPAEGEGDKPAEGGDNAAAPGAGNTL